MRTLVINEHDGPVYPQPDMAYPIIEQYVIGVSEFNGAQQVVGWVQVIRVNTAAPFTKYGLPTGAAH